MIGSMSQKVYEDASHIIGKQVYVIPAKAGIQIVGTQVSGFPVMLGMTCGFILILRCT